MFQFFFPPFVLFLKRADEVAIALVVVGAGLLGFVPVFVAGKV